MIRQDFIPLGSSNRPGTRLRPTHITVHETDNTSKGANADAHARYLKGPDARRRSVSWHFTVDDKEIVQHLPTNEIGWHAGSKGNLASIGIEICVNSDGNFEKAKQNAQWLIRKLMNTHNISLDNVVTHNYWTGKNCPRRLRPEWEQFKQGIKNASPATRKKANVIYKGKSVEGFIEDGRTYVQVRDLANLLGLAIHWDQNTSTVTLGGK